MKFTVPKKEFVEALGRIQQIAGNSRATMPILNFVHLTATATGLIVTATDLDTG
jgi:DNA polymerase III sliding clamp (beta) subunit (PCNA family)